MLVRTDLLEPRPDQVDIRSRVWVVAQASIRNVFEDERTLATERRPQVAADDEHRNPCFGHVDIFEFRVGKQMIQARIRNLPCVQLGN